ncbi:MAG: carbohydrate-binding family 9-like protein [Acidobacteriota bacterium]
MERETGDLKSESGDTAIAHRVDFDLRAADLDHLAWTSVPAINLHRYWSGEEAPSIRHAESRIVWSEEALVVRFLCPQAGPLIVSPNPQTDRKSIGLWDRDVCELFVAPDLSEPNRYFEFEAAPTGEWIDLAIHRTARGRETDWDFHSGMTAAAHITNDRILIAMRIPWGMWIHKPQRGDRWRANLFRCVGIGEERGYIAWKPTRTAQPDFHVPDAFGWLRFT